jgi:DNA (cytosine-5)-methyltransferase 1
MADLNPANRLDRRSIEHQLSPQVIPGAEDDYADDDVGRDLEALRDRIRTARLHRNRGSVDRAITIDDEAAESKLVIDLQEVIDLTDEVPRTEAARAAAPRNDGERYIDQHLHGRLRLKKGMVVELKNALTMKFKPTFVRITSIVVKRGAQVVLRGSTYVRARQMFGQLPRKLNEVCLVEMIDSSDPQPWTVDIDPADVLRIREMRTTNSAYPKHRFNQEDAEWGLEWIEENGPLVCRYRYVEHYADFITKPYKPREWALIRVTEQGADVKYRETDDAVLAQWRGAKVPGGSYLPHKLGAEVIDLDSDVDVDVPKPVRGQGDRVRLEPGQRYTAGDTFSGAGGASRGMTQAGAHLQFTIDHWDHAVASIKKNFPLATNYGMEITDFITDKDIHHRVDMLHLSPPCQVWSPAHTVAGKNDDMNLAALFSCTDLINKCRPRMFTLEQTFGILHGRFSNYFNLLIQGFTVHGYSVRWKVVNLATYGLPQPRRRLIIIGAGPGEKLPDFPDPTHSLGGAGGLKPIVTAHQATAPARAASQRDNPLNVKKPLNRIQIRWNPHTPIPRTITCSGGQNYHWSGKRDFTLLEYALLQGFPVNHKFNDQSVKKQIGNAFPPSVVRHIYDHLTAWLDKHDNVDRSTRIKEAAIPGEGVSNPCVISDGEDVAEIISVAQKPRQVMLISDNDSSSNETSSDEQSGEEDVVITNSGKRRRSVEYSTPTPAKRHQKDSFVVIDDSSDEEERHPTPGPSRNGSQSHGARKPSDNPSGNVTLSMSRLSLDPQPAKKKFSPFTVSKWMFPPSSSDEPPSDPESAALCSSSPDQSPRTPTPFRPRTPGNGDMPATPVGFTGSVKEGKKKEMVNKGRWISP